MRIACPACNATYQVPDDQLREGRTVRCARCATDWVPVVAAVEPAPDIEPLPAPEPTPEPTPEPPIEPPVEPAPAPAEEPGPVPDALPRKMAIDDTEAETAIKTPPPLTVAPKPRRTLPLLAIAWVLSLAIVGGALAALVMQRDRVMTAWPPSQRAYAALGLAPR